MSDEKKVQEQEDVKLKGSEDDGSLSSILGETPHPVFTGHPAAGEAYEPEEKPEELEEKPEEPEEPPAKTPEEPRFKYKSHEEAEAGAAAHQRMATEKAEEAARLREELAALKAKAEEKPPEQPERTPEEVDAEKEARIESALGEISDLDEFDPDYRKKVARAWAKAGFGGASMPASELIEQVWGKIEERLKERETPHDTRQRAEEMAASQGLDMSQGTADNILFWAKAKEAPTGVAFEEQVAWTVQEVRKLAPGKMSDAERALAEKARLTNAPLERGGSPPPSKKEDTQSYSLNSILEGQMQSRII